MTRDELVDKVRHGIQVGSADCRGWDLSGLDLSGAMMDDVDFGGANFSHAHLEGSSLSHCTRWDGTSMGWRQL